MQALNRRDWAVKELALMHLLVGLNARHLCNTESSMNQPEVFKERASKADVVALFEPKFRGKPHQHRQEELSIHGLIGPQSVRQ
jgi:hypothetical protein